MATLLLKNVPESLRVQLKRRAVEHRRSMNQEALYILEQAMPQPLDLAAIRAFKPIKLKGAVDVVEDVRQARQDKDLRYDEIWGDLKAPLVAEGKPAKKRRLRRAR